jgi:hypothetical protein
MVAEHQEPPRSGRGDGTTADTLADTRLFKRQKVDNATAQPETRRRWRGVDKYRELTEVSI